MEPLIGSYDLKLDSKVRLSLPLAFRKAMGVHTDDEIMLTLGPDGCVAGMDIPSWNERYLPRLMSLSWTRGEDRSLLRDIGPRSFRVRIDSENRVIVPGTLLTWAGIRPGDTVAVQGVFGHFEIWEPSRLEAREGGGTTFEDRLERRLGDTPDGSGGST